MTAYRYTHRRAERMIDHADHTWEEWHAYVCDLTDAPEWVTGDSTGLCCHTCELVIVDQAPTDLSVDELVADLDRAVDRATGRDHAEAVAQDPLTRVLVKLRGELDASEARWRAELHRRTVRWERATATVEADPIRAAGCAADAALLRAIVLDGPNVPGACCPVSGDDLALARAFAVRGSR